MARLLFLARQMDELADVIVVLVAIVWSWPLNEVASTFLAFISIFYVLLRLKQLIQQQYFNSLWGAIKSLFKRKNRYGEDKRKK